MLGSLENVKQECWSQDKSSHEKVSSHVFHGTESSGMYRVIQLRAQDLQYDDISKPRDD